MTYGNDVWQRFDNYGEVSSLVLKAYAVSLLLLASVLMWTVGDAWMQYATSSFDSIYTNNFTLGF